ncbi:MAG: helicase [Cyclobacterium sp.]|nr:helicase [Cyclobacterium sp.]
MQIKLFTIPLTDDGSAQDEMNRFLQAQKIVKIESQFISESGGAMWCFCVSFLSNCQGSQASYPPGKKVDYKNLLSEEAFQRFSKLRDIRKELASEDAVPAYAVFTDVELSEMAKSENLDATSILGIRGIAGKRFEKYGKAMLEKYSGQVSQI